MLDPCTLQWDNEQAATTFFKTVVFINRYLFEQILKIFGPYLENKLAGFRRFFSKISFTKMANKLYALSNGKRLYRYLSTFLFRYQVRFLGLIQTKNGLDDRSELFVTFFFQGKKFSDVRNLASLMFGRALVCDLTGAIGGGNRLP